MTHSEQLYKRACRVMPGGVNSPVRAFGAVGGSPRFIQSAQGPFLFDADGGKYVDFVGSWGPMILGHNHPAIAEAVCKAARDGLSFGAATEKEVLLAELICENVPGVELLRMVNSGTEAVMSAIRAARGFTRREKIIKFSGCYHGHADALLVAAGSGVLTAGLPGSAGVPAGAVKDTLTAVYNDAASVEALFLAFPGEIAAVIVEPVAANMGVVCPKEGFLETLRSLCTKHGALLIFDEVITGFRLSFGGAQEYFNVRADLVTYGKIIGGGMPVGASGGRREIMEQGAPLGAVYQAGTLSGNPVAMAAGLAQLTVLKETPGLYEKLNEKAARFFGEIRRIAADSGRSLCVNACGSLGSLFFTAGPVENYEQARTADLQAYADYFQYMLGQGVYLAPAQFEAMFLSAVHGENELGWFLEVLAEYLHE